MPEERWGITLVTPQAYLRFSSLSVSHKLPESGALSWPRIAPNPTLAYQ
jgi:hypothetical protein